MHKRKVICRADGNSLIGFGHFFRVLAIAEMIKDEFDVFVAITSPEDFVRQQLSLNGVGLIELPYYDYSCFPHCTEELEFDMDSIVSGDEIVVLDGYLFGDSYRKNLKSKGCAIVYIDDVYAKYKYVDVIVNHCISASASRYFDTEAQVFAGPKYSLMRRKFLDAAKQTVTKSKFDTAFVCFGGADTEELAYKISSFMLLGCLLVKHLHVLNSSSYKGDIQKFYQMVEGLDKTITVHQNLKSIEIIELMNRADFAVVSASNIAYECACTKLPMVAGYYVDHQMSFYEALSKQDNVIGLHKWQDASSGLVNESIEKLVHEYDPQAPAFIDGEQQERFMYIFKSIPLAALVQ